MNNYYGVYHRKYSIIKSIIETVHPVFMSPNQQVGLCVEKPVIKAVYWHQVAHNHFPDDLAQLAQVQGDAGYYCYALQLILFSKSLLTSNTLKELPFQLPIPSSTTICIYHLNYDTSKSP